VGALPLSELLISDPQTSWVPATVAVVGTEKYVTFTLAEDGGQVPLEIVQVYVYVPSTDTVAVDEPEVLLLKVLVPGPDVWVHRPVPIMGALPPSELLVKPQSVCAAPTLAGVGVS
jgi:hypothetical protein